MLPKRVISALCLSVIGALSMTALLFAAQGDTTVPDAARQGDRDGLRSLLKQGADVNASQGDGMTALHWAAYNRDLEMGQMLIYAGANVHAATRINSITPLFMAAKNGSAPLIEALLGAGADANSTLTTGTTPLMAAAALGAVEAVTALLEHGADVNATEVAHGQTALTFAAAFNSDAVIKVLMRRGADPTIATNVLVVPPPPDPEDGGQGECQEVSATAQTQDTAATQTADAAPARSQAAAVADGPDKKAKKEEATPQQAADANASECAKQQQQNRGSSDRGGRPEFLGGLSPLLFAAREGHMEAVGALLDAGAGVDEVNPGDKSSPLLVAIVNGHYDVARFLLERGADPTLADTLGATPLYAVVNVQWAPESGYPQPDPTQQKVTHLGLMKALLERGADPNARLKRPLWWTSYTFNRSQVSAAGATPFWRAAQSSDVEAMRVLLAFGADPNIPSEEGVAPLGVAAGAGVHGTAEVFAPGGRLPAVEYLVDELGLDVNRADPDSYTPLHYAAAIGDNEIVLYLVSKGAGVDAVSKHGETVADMANSPETGERRKQPFPETIALLIELGSEFNDKCTRC